MLFVILCGCIIVSPLPEKPVREGEGRKNGLRVIYVVINYLLGCPIQTLILVSRLVRVLEMSANVEKV